MFCQIACIAKLKMLETIFFQVNFKRARETLLGCAFSCRSFKTCFCVPFQVAMKFLGTFAEKLVQHSKRLNINCNFLQTLSSNTFATRRIFLQTERVFGQKVWIENH